MTDWKTIKEDDWTKEKINELINNIEDGDTYLYLECVNLGDKGAELLSYEFKERLKGLTRLDLFSCSIKEEGIKSIMREIHHLKSLDTLDLSNNEFGSNEGIIIANELSNLTSVEVLFLSGNNIGPYSSIAIINELKNLPKLGLISCIDNNIGNEGCKAIIDILPDRTGKRDMRVDLRSNNLTDDVLKEIKGKGKRKNFDVSANTYSSDKDQPNFPTFVYKNANQIIEYDHLSKFQCPSLCFLSLSIIRDGDVNIPDHCIQATTDAIDRELYNGLKLQTSIKEENGLSACFLKCFGKEVEKYHIVSLSNIILRKTKL